MVFKQTFDEDVFLVFLERLLRQVQGKIFLIVDAHPAHCSDKVRGWVKARSERIRLFFLPAYSPQLNPDETSFYSADNTVDDGTDFIFIFRQYDFPFGFAQSLQNNLLGGLGGYSAKVFDFLYFFDSFTHLSVFFVSLSLG